MLLAKQKRNLRQLSAKQFEVYTNRDLVALIQEMQTQPFAPLMTYQGSKDPALGPQQRPASFVIVIITIIRNMVLIQDNTEFIATHPRLIDMLLRLCDVEETDGKPPAPTAKNLSVADVLLIRKETMAILTVTASLINLAHSPTSPTTLRMARRGFRTLCVIYGRFRRICSTPCHRTADRSPSQYEPQASTPHGNGS